MRRTSLRARAHPPRAASRAPRAPARGAPVAPGPHTAPVTAGCESTQAKASVVSRDAASLGLGFECVEPVEDAVVDETLVRLGTLGHARARREWLAAPVLARQPAARERPERDVGDARRSPQSGRMPTLVLPVEQRVRVLDERRPAVGERLADTGLVVVAEPPGADDALLDEALERCAPSRRAASAGRARGRDRGRCGRRRAVRGSPRSGAGPGRARGRCRPGRRRWSGTPSSSAAALRVAAPRASGR